MQFNIYNTLIIAGIIQGFIFCVVAFISPKFRSKSNYLLASLILVYSIGNFQYVIPDIGLISLPDMYHYVYLPWASLIPVLIFFYGNSYLNPDFNVQKHKLLLLPFLLALVITLLFKVGFVLGVQAQNFISVYYYFVRVHESFSVLYALLLLILLLIRVNRVEKEYRTFDVSVVRSDLNWLKQTLYVIFIFTLVWGYLTYRNQFVDGAQPDFYVLWIGIACTIYWLGHIGLYKYGIREEQKKIRKHRIARQDGSVVDSSRNDHIIAFERLLINEKRFLDSQLSLEKVADTLELSSGYLSRMIKLELNTSFPEYLNSLRIREAKAYLNNPEFANYTITSIGLEAGFNSKSAFYDSFKKQTGKTPLAYKKDHTAR